MAIINELIFFAYIAITTGALVVATLIGFEAVIALISLEWVLANFFVTKQIVLFGFQATASDALAVGALLGLNLLQEYKGKEFARRTIKIGFFCLFFYLCVSVLHLLYYPASSDVMSPYFIHLLTPLPRLVIASLATYLIVQYLEYAIYSMLQARFGRRYFILRNYASLSISQLVDTILFSFLGLYGIVDHIWQIILVSYGIKLITVLVSVPFIRFSKKIMGDTLP